MKIGLAGMALEPDGIVVGIKTVITSTVNLKVAAFQTTVLAIVIHAVLAPLLEVAGHVVDAEFVGQLGADAMGHIATVTAVPRSV